MKSDISGISQIKILNLWALTKHIVLISHHTHNTHSFNEVRFLHIATSHSIIE